MFPDHWKAFVETHGLVGLSATIEEDDLSGVGADLRFLSEAQAIDELSNVWPAIGVAADGCVLSRFTPLERRPGGRVEHAHVVWIEWTGQAPGPWHCGAAYFSTCSFRPARPRSMKRCLTASTPTTVITAAATAR